jgi:hypothetical protein
VSDRERIQIDPEKLAHDHADAIDDLDGVEQIVGIFDEQLAKADRIALGIDRLVPTDEVIVPESEPEI